MLQALRYMISAAGDKMSEPIRRAIHQTLIGMLSHPEDISRSAAAGCLGALCQWFTPEQLNVVLSDHLLCKYYTNFLKIKYLTLCGEWINQSRLYLHCCLDQLRKIG